jgi:hypothetical protein
MSEGTGEPAKADEQLAGGGLQFDRVELSSPQAPRTCPACQTLMGAEYYEVAGNVICPACATAIGSGQNAGSFVRAVGFGAGAAILSTLIWYAIIKATDSEWGLVAIGVGLFVGFAVNKGARGIGGTRYQALAIALTYVAITFSKVPIIVDAVVQGDSAKESAAATDPRATSAPSAPPAAEAAAAPSLGGFLVAWGFILAIALASPFLQGAQGIMGILILAIALYEAWKLNKRVPVTGPFRFGSVAAT